MIKNNSNNIFKHYINAKTFSVWDIILIVVLLTIVILLFVFGFSYIPGNKVEIHHGNIIIGTYPLSKNQNITVYHNTHKIVITIKDNNVYISENDCKNQICVKTGKICNTGDRIICVPHQIMVIIKGNKKIYTTGT